MYQFDLSPSFVSWLMPACIQINLDDLVCDWGKISSILCFWQEVDKSISVACTVSYNLLSTSLE